MKKKVAIIGTNGLPARYGGFETLANYLTIHLKGLFDFIVYCSSDNSSLKQEKFNDAKLIYIPLKANGFQSVFYDIISMIHAAFTADVLLILGTPGAIFFPILKLFKKKIIINFGGFEWKREKWPKIVRNYLKLTEKFAINYADYIVADNQHFINYIDLEYGKKAILIEYGGDHVQKMFNDNLFEKYKFSRDTYLISVSRAQIDNNIHLLLEAYEKSKINIKLVIISNWRTSKYGIELKNKYANRDNIILLDAIYSQEELDFLRSKAYMYIHTHSFCGTAPSLVEAMHHKIPIICFDVETNRFTTENKSLYFSTANDLVNILLGEMEYLNSLKSDIYEIAVRRYGWETISKKYASLF